MVGSDLVWQLQHNVSFFVQINIDTEHSISDCLKLFILSGFRIKASSVPGKFFVL